MMTTSALQPAPLRPTSPQPPAMSGSSRSAQPSPPLGGFFGHIVDRLGAVKSKVKGAMASIKSEWTSTTLPSLPDWRWISINSAPDFIDFPLSASNASVLLHCRCSDGCVVAGSLRIEQDVLVFAMDDEAKGVAGADHHPFHHRLIPGDDHTTGAGFAVPLRLIQRVGLQTAAAWAAPAARGVLLGIDLHDFRTLSFTVLRQELARPFVDFIAFSCRSSGGCDSSAAASAAAADEEGWDLARDNALLPTTDEPPPGWRQTLVNEGYSVCPTYPRRLWVPVGIVDDTLGQAALFRSKGRLPVLSYLHEATGASLSRCSQPRRGLGQRRCVADEALVRAIFTANPLMEPSDTHGHIIDCRPMVNAMLNFVGGKGVENVHDYGCKLTYLGIENIHQMRASAGQLVMALRDKRNADTVAAMVLSGGIPPVLSCITAEPAHKAELVAAVSLWLGHVDSVLQGAARTAAEVAAGESVMVHCSDGWDRTAQITSLAQLLLDPRCRTRRGFCQLVAKDWLSFGHKFGERYGFARNKPGNDRETSPIFTQFLDCCWQLVRLQPSRFEFNGQFLLEVHFAVTGQQHGTFLGNCEREREELRLAGTTTSAWLPLLTSEIGLNPAFEPLDDVIAPDSVLSSGGARLWVDMYRPHF